MKKDMKETLTESDKIWNEIKDLYISMYALPDQKVKDHVDRIKLSPKELHLKLHSPSVIANLEPALNSRTDSVGNVTLIPRFELELMDNGYVVVRRVVNT